ncbi:MAG: hypothetical protein PUF48_02785 [Oscillospiraceae bacterium]|nr:hypothetical protein [Oscillospiraceae bacterium]
MKKCLALVLVTILLLCLIPTTVVFAAKAESINQLTLTVTAPQEGEKPAYDKIDGRGYYSDNGLNGVSTRIYKNGIAWYKSASSYFSPGTTATFEGDKSYIVKINLLPKGNFEFASNMTATINGKTATVEHCDSDGSVVVAATLTSTADNKKAISKVDLTVVKPVIGKTPTFAKVDTTQYVSEKYGTVSNCSNGVTWTNQGSGTNITVSNPFKDGTKYRVTYYLTAKDGYKFDSNTKGAINGATATVSVTDATHAKVSLSDLVPGDGKKEVSSVSIYVTAPKEGEKPNYTKIDGTEYYSDNGINGISTKIYKNGIAWYKSTSSYISPGTTETFKDGTEYTVKIALTPKDGYKFAKNVSAKLNGKTATVESFDDGSINISVKLTALSKEHKHTDSGWKTDKNNHWKICTDTVCGTITVAKEAHKDQNKDNKCDVCEYAIPKKGDDTSTPVEPTPDSSTPETPDSSNQTDTDDSQKTDAETDDKTEHNKETDGKKNGALIWIILAAVVVLVAGGAITFIVLKKKNNKV